MNIYPNLVSSINIFIPSLLFFNPIVCNNYSQNVRTTCILYVMLSCHCLCVRFEILLHKQVGRSMQISEVIKDKSGRSFTTSRYDLLGLSDKAAGQGSDLCLFICKNLSSVLPSPAHAELQTVSKHTICNIYLIYFQVP